MMARASFRRLAVIVVTTYKERQKKACVYTTFWERENLSFLVSVLNWKLSSNKFCFPPNNLSVMVLIHLVLPSVSLLSPSPFPQHSFIPSLGEFVRFKTLSSCAASGMEWFPLNAQKPMMITAQVMMMRPWSEIMANKMKRKRYNTWVVNYRTWYTLFIVGGIHFLTEQIPRIL